jgi:hypothetical protein
MRFHLRSRLRLTTQPPGPTPPPALLTPLAVLDAADWLCASLTTFATSVASILPGHFPAYARVYNPFGDVRDPGGVVSWSSLAAQAGRDLTDPAAAADFALGGVSSAQARTGTATLSVISALVEHLRPATTTPEECYFALWEGYSIFPPALVPKLELPNRAYYIYIGPLEAALSSFDPFPFSQRSANLWWPADQAWCVATEVDFAWTYVGGPRSCIDAILSDARLDAVETSARARW